MEDVQQQRRAYTAQEEAILGHFLSTMLVVMDRCPIRGQTSELVVSHPFCIPSCNQDETVVLVVPLSTSSLQSLIDAFWFVLEVGKKVGSSGFVVTMAGLFICAGTVDALAPHQDQTVERG